MTTRLSSPLVTVVIPLYNARSWIVETIASVALQMYEREALEVVVVDDGSNDGGGVLAEAALSMAKIQYQIIVTTNGGPSRARNIGWRHAQGEWIQFLDADDLIDPHKIAIQAKATAILSSDVAVVYSEWQRLTLVDGEWQANNILELPQIRHDPVSDLLKTENFIATGSQLFRRSWLEKVKGFDERHQLIEDVDLLLRIAMAGGLFYCVAIGRPLFSYRQHAQSLSRSNPRAFIEGCVRNARMVEEDWKSHNMITPSRSCILTQVYFQGARFFAAVDKYEFKRLVDAIEVLTPGFLPSGPPFLRMLSRGLGYPHAELIAVFYRRIKRSAFHLTIRMMRSLHNRSTTTMT